MTNNQIINELDFIFENYEILINSAPEEIYFFFDTTLDQIESIYNNIGIDDDDDDNTKEAPVDDEGYYLFGAPGYLHNYSNNVFNKINLFDFNLLNNYFYQPNNLLNYIFKDKIWFFYLNDYLKLKLDLTESNLDLYLFNFIENTLKIGNNINIEQWIIYTELDAYLSEEFCDEIFSYSYDKPHWGDITIPWFIWFEVEGNKFRLLLVPDFPVYIRIWRDVCIDYLERNWTYWLFSYSNYTQSFYYITFWYPIFVILIIDIFILIKIARIYTKITWNDLHITWKYLKWKLILKYFIEKRLYRFFLFSLVLIIWIILSGNQLYWALIMKHYIYYFKHVHIISQSINFIDSSNILINSFGKHNVFLIKTESLKLIDKLYSLLHLL